ncbi:MAG TPA: PDGLE domain-containing protein [Methanobacterium sp.]|nr:PDGLE domain-containing protein [Methanobacterium sp.]
MSPKDKKLVVAGIAICFIIAILSPFIASSNPDGLEKSAEQFSSADESGIYEAPLPDYTFEPLGKFGEIVALALGAIVMLILGYIVAMLFRRKTPPESSK